MSCLGLETVDEESRKEGVSFISKNIKREFGATNKVQEKGQTA